MFFIVRKNPTEILDVKVLCFFNNYAVLSDRTFAGSMMVALWPIDIIQIVHKLFITQTLFIMYFLCRAKCYLYPLIRRREIIFQRSFPKEILGTIFKFI